MQRAGAARLIPGPQLTRGTPDAGNFFIARPARENHGNGRARAALARPHAVEDIVNLIEEVARP